MCINSMLIWIEDINPGPVPLDGPPCVRNTFVIDYVNCKALTGQVTNHSLTIGTVTGSPDQDPGALKLQKQDLDPDQTSDGPWH